MGITTNEMPGKKRKYNSRFPPARIKKIMQTDKEVGKVAAAVPVIISRALELFLKSLLTKSCQITQSKHSRTMTQAHLRQCIETEKHFEFLKDLMSRAPPVPSPQEDNGAKGVRAAQRKRWQDIGLKVKHRGTAEKPRGQNEGSLDSITHSDDSEPEMLFCLGKDMPKHPSANRTRSFKGQDPSASAVLVWYP
ncbi:dr1-associated corepressor isoform X2 [Lepisosteus oculatus]|uniref:dr1-associated corepressor isoform X2 n=1 Tax=Lepisosteus oculatus TaxID=7918 RepID=UPI0007400928|nr:PREDICTED: dr1-associated corepressor isoform X2 [Lepisosteus oculatus]